MKFFELGIMEINPIGSSVEEAAEILELQRTAYQIEARIYNDFSIQPLRQTLEELKEEYQNQKPSVLFTWFR